MSAREELSACLRALDALPDRQREVVGLRAFEGLTTSEVAARLETSPGNVRVMLHRARQQLRAATGNALRRAPRERVSHAPPSPATHWSRAS